MKYWPLAAAALLAILLTGCSSVKNPADSAASLALKQDLVTCRATSHLEIPAKMVVITPAISLPDQINCLGGGSRGVSGCVRIPGISLPAIEEDLNADARAQVFSACLMAKLYSEQPVLASVPNNFGAHPVKNLALPSAQLEGNSSEVLAGVGSVGNAADGANLLEARRSHAWQGIKDCDFCPRMVLIPAGNFKMGSTANSSEQPIHSVKQQSFLLGKYEVTQAEWASVMGSNPSANKSCGSRCPVERVSWNSAQEFLKRLNSRTGLNFRLSSESEWEYAARAGRSSQPSDEELQTLKNVAWYNGNSEGELHQVGQMIPNEFGLHDMQGNVWEWVEDGHHDNYLGASPFGQARQISAQTQGKRVLRGGSYFDNPKSVRTTHRNADTPDAVYVFFGLRVARDLEPAMTKAE
jgi:formylglycine-generating enzyme required for sulfatase activity